jgi:hypothetical protein
MYFTPDRVRDCPSPYETGKIEHTIAIMARSPSRMIQGHCLFKAAV